MKKAIFLDKDGTLIEDVPYNVNPDLIRLMPGALQGLQQLHAAGYELVVITNQSGIARGYFKEEALKKVEQRLRELLAEGNVPLAGFYYCPHLPDGSVAEYATNCDCRKPEPGLLKCAARELEINLKESWFIGDILNDVEAGRKAGCRTILLDNGHETVWRLTPERMPDRIAADLIEAARLINFANGEIVTSATSATVSDYLPGVAEPASWRLKVALETPDYVKSGGSYQ